jgi:hypothetical protein
MSLYDLEQMIADARAWQAIQSRYREIFRVDPQTSPNRLETLQLLTDALHTEKARTDVLNQQTEDTNQL